MVFDIVLWLKFITDIIIILLRILHSYCVLLFLVPYPTHFRLCLNLTSNAQSHFNLFIMQQHFLFIFFLQFNMVFLYQILKRIRMCIFCFLITQVSWTRGHYKNKKGENVECNNDGPPDLNTALCMVKKIPVEEVCQGNHFTCDDGTCIVSKFTAHLA